MSWWAGFDIGGTAIKHGVLERDAVTSPTSSIPTDARFGPDDAVTRIAAIVREWTDARGAPPDGIGIACAGLVDSGAGCVVSSPNLAGWRDVPLRALAAHAFGTEPRVLNDANAFVLAEGRLGAARGARAVFGLAIGTGVGGGFLLGGDLWLGAHGFAGEPGHMPIAPDGPRCACGRSGCLESFLGTRAIVERHRVGGGMASDPREIAALARGGDPSARSVFEETGRVLGRALAIVVALFDPDGIVVGGGVAEAHDLFLPAARAELARRTITPTEHLPTVAPAQLGPGAGWIGAALSAREAPGARSA